MKLNKQKDGTLYIVTNSPLLIYDNMNNSRIACELDEARLFMLTTKNSRTGAVETDVRLHTIEDDLELARKRELEYLQIPLRYLRNEPEINEVYIGRYRVVMVSSLGSTCGNTLVEARTGLVPVPIPQFNWNTSDDGQEMLELAANAGVDQRKVYQAAAACARLTIHLIRNMPQPRLALDAVETWSSSNAGDDDMERAIFENNPGRDEILCGLHQHDECFSYAADAASCNPLNVVANVALAAGAEFKNMTRDMDYAAARKCHSQVQNVMRSACANIIRGAICIADYPALAILIKRRNEELCRAPITELSRWAD